VVLIVASLFYAARRKAAPRRLKREPSVT